MKPQALELTKHLDSLSDTAKHDLFAFIVSSSDARTAQDEGEYLQNALSIARARQQRARG